MERVEFRWTHRWSKTYQQTIFYNTYQPKTPYPVALKFFKGELHALFSRRFTEFLIESEHGRKYLEWCWDTGHPSEHYWNTLNYNKHLDAPGGYTGRRFINRFRSGMDLDISFDEKYKIEKYVTFPFAFSFTLSFIQ